MTTHRLTFPFLLAVLTAGMAPAQQQQQQSSNSQARADARADARNGESRSSTHRVVVKDGKTVVDERNDGGAPAGGGAGPLPLPLPDCGNPDDMLRDLQEQVRQQLGNSQLGGGPCGQPQPQPKPTPNARPQPTGKPTPATRPTARPKPAVRPSSKPADRPTTRPATRPTPDASKERPAKGQDRRRHA